jgi:hypothetical protein
MLGWSLSLVNRRSLYLFSWATCGSRQKPTSFIYIGAVIRHPSRPTARLPPSTVVITVSLLVSMMEIEFLNELATYVVFFCGSTATSNGERPTANHSYSRG